MSTRIRVILLEDIPDVGKAGDIVSVAEGFARNSLFPAGRAALATDKEMSRAQQKKQAAKQREEGDLRRRQEQAEAIDGTELTITARVKEEDEIFGAVTAATVAEELKKANITVAAGDIKLPAKKITALGTYETVVAFGSGVEAKLQLVVIADAADAPKQENE